MPWPSGKRDGDEFIRQLVGQHWRALSDFLFPSESGHTATKPLCSGEGKGDSGWEARLGEPSFSAVPAGLLHRPAEHNKKPLSESRPKEKVLSRITVMIREAIFLFLIHLCW